MEELKSKFYGKEISKTEDFLLNDNKILYVKRENESSDFDFLSGLLLKEKDKFLFFKYFFSEHSVMEDVLLDFYDTLRTFSINKKINLKKSAEEDFSKKVITYVREINSDVLAVFENLEKVSDREEITGFIENLIRCNNTKVIICTKGETENSIYQNFSSESEVLNISSVSKDMLKEAYKEGLIKDTPETLNKFYEIIKNNDFALFSSLNYVNITNSKLEDLINEFSKRRTGYENFIIGKMISLVPPQYTDILKFMSLISQPVSSKFIQEYNMGTKSQIDYLSGKLIINKTCKGLLIDEEYKKYFRAILTLGEKTEYINKIISSYKNEITKKPQDRLIRLSREGLRGQIEKLKENIPHTNRSSSQEINFNFANQQDNFKVPWLNTNITEKNTKESNNSSNNFMTSEDSILLKLINEKKYQNSQSKVQSREDNEIREIKNLIEEAEKNYKYEDAIVLLNALGNKIKSEDISLINEINDKIAKNLINSGKNKEAIIYYSKISDNYRNEKDFNNSACFELRIAKIYQNTYAIENAKKICDKIINSTRTLEDKIVSEAHYRLASINEKENKNSEAEKNYKKAYEIARNSDDNELLIKITFAIALLYNNQNKNEEAEKYYLENIEYSKNAQNDNIGICYMNLATIYYHDENDKEAIKYFDLAINEYSKDKENNYSGLYYANKSLAKIYKNIDNQKCGHCLEEEFYYAKALDDNFKIINAVVELGDYFYDTSQDNKALVYYLYARNILKESDDSAQNQEIIEARINDMKLKMPKEIFEGIVAQNADRTTPNI